MRNLMLLFTLNLIFVFTATASEPIPASEGEVFITDDAYRYRVSQDFAKRKEFAKGRSEELFSVLRSPNISYEEFGALQFLYAYMPLCDLAEYDGEFMLEQVRGAFRARDYFHWGRTVPEDIFRHFVLVHRINNEYLDDSRDVFFEELKDRIAHLSMEEAALEVNHWCHEKVTYRATDPRTSSPLALVKTSWGRCGEESAFTAAAMRAVGIPARQVYTPRWVHTDSNHAWVEVWIDGKWRYLGACEPEPELDAAWFSAPAKRMMMAHTTVIGPYYGPEEVNHSTALYSTINLLGNYSDTRNAVVRVTDTDGRPVEGARVKFKAYNYAQFYTLSTVVTDSYGDASIVTGNGDIFVWADKDGHFGYGIASPGEVPHIILDRSPGRIHSQASLIDVPAEKPVKGLTPEQIAANAMRLAQEDSIRNAYMSTFATEDYAKKVAGADGLDPAMVWKYLHLSQGNWQEIEAFITANKNNPLLFPFLGTLLEKDLRDTPASILDDHLNSGQRPTAGIPEELFVSKVLAPRVHIELIKPWRRYLMDIVEADPRLQTPEGIIEYVDKNITLNNADNYYACLLTPRGTHELGIADSRSRNVYFVALCRAAGIPAHVESATGKPQYYSNGRWFDAKFSDTTEPVNLPKGTLVLENHPDNIIKPGYQKHFTIGYFSEGDFRTLDLSRDPRLNEYPATIELDEGYYQLMTGSRLNDGSVSLLTKYFVLEAGKSHTEEIRFPDAGDKLFVKGIIDMNSVATPDGDGKTSLKELSGGRGLILVFADPDKEPTKHILQDLPSQKRELEEWGGGIVFMVPDDKKSVSFDASMFGGLPSQITWATDTGRELLDSAIDALQIEFNDNFPLVIYLNTNGGVLFSTAGYRIGIGEDLIRTIRLEEESKK